MNNDETEERGSQSGNTFKNVLIPVSNPQTAEQMVRLAAALTDTSSVLHIMNVTLNTSFLNRTSSWRRSSELVMEMSHLGNRLERVTKPLASTASSIPEAILNARKEINADLLIMGWFGRVTPLAVKKSRVVKKVLQKAGCDVAILKSRNKLQDVERVVVPVGGGTRPERISLVQNFLARKSAELLLTNVLPHDSEQKEEEQVGEMLTQTAQLFGTTTKTNIQKADNMVDGLLQETKPNDLIIIGPGREWVFKSVLFGRHADAITNRAPCSVVMYKSREQKVSAWFRGMLKAASGFLTPGTGKKL